MLAARTAMRTAPGDEDKTVSHGDEDGPEHATLCALAIPLSCSEEELMLFFAFFGDVLNVYIPELHTEHKGRRFGFVTFALVAAAAHARSNAQHRAFTVPFSMCSGLLARSAGALLTDSRGREPNTESQGREPKTNTESRARSFPKTLITTNGFSLSQTHP